MRATFSRSLQKIRALPSRWPKWVRWTALALAACSAKVSTLTGSDADQSLSQAAQLLVGTLKLEGTSNAADAKEAAELLPLWQAYRQLTDSDTAAQAEIEAVIAQIQETMTKDQVQAITAMKLTRQDELSVMSSLGLAASNGTSGASSIPQASSSGGTSSGFSGGFPGGAGGPPAGGAPPAGGFAPGGDFGGGFPGAGSSGASATLSTTQLAARAANSNRISPVLLNALIDLLQKRAGS